MCPASDNPATRKIHAPIRLLQAKTMKAVENHRELCVAVYAQNVMSE
jgi:hypothetical protein